jgi:hypothetical protein
MCGVCCVCGVSMGNEKGQRNFGTSMISVFEVRFESNHRCLSIRLVTVGLQLAACSLQLKGNVPYWPTDPV